MVRDAWRFNQGEELGAKWGIQLQAELDIGSKQTPAMGMAGTAAHEQEPRMRPIAACACLFQGSCPCRSAAHLSGTTSTSPMPGMPAVKFWQKTSSTLPGPATTQQSHDQMKGITELLCSHSWPASTGCWQGNCVMCAQRRALSPIASH